MVQEEQTQTYAVHVPVQVERQIEVPVCRLVEQTVSCPAPALQACCDADGRVALAFSGARHWRDAEDDDD
jgi:hypothetical protein